MKKKLLATLLSFAMLFSLLPVSALATNAAGTFDPPAVSANGKTINITSAAVYYTSDDTAATAVDGTIRYAVYAVNSDVENKEPVIDWAEKSAYDAGSQSVSTDGTYYVYAKFTATSSGKSKATTTGVQVVISDTPAPPASSPLAGTLSKPEAEPNDNKISITSGGEYSGSEDGVAVKFAAYAVNADVDKADPIISWAGKTSFEGAPVSDGNYVVYAMASASGYKDKVSEPSGTVSITYTADHVITSFTSPTTITVDYGTLKTAVAEQLLSTYGTVTATLKSTATESIPVTAWTCGDYDGSTAGDYTFTGTLGDLPTGVTNPNSMAPTVTVTVDAAPNTAITGFNPLDTTSVEYGTEKATVQTELKNKYGTVTATLANGTTATITVREWTCGDYNGNTAGDYTFTGTLGDLPTDVTNPSSKAPTVTVTVKQEAAVALTAKTATQSVMVSKVTAEGKDFALTLNGSTVVFKASTDPDVPTNYYTVSGDVACNVTVTLKEVTSTTATVTVKLKDAESPASIGTITITLDPNTVKLADGKDATHSLSSSRVLTATIKVKADECTCSAECADGDAGHASGCPVCANNYSSCKGVGSADVNGATAEVDANVNSDGEAKTTVTMDSGDINGFVAAAATAGTAEVEVNPTNSEGYDITKVEITLPAALVEELQKEGSNVAAVQITATDTAMGEVKIVLPTSVLEGDKPLTMEVIEPEEAAEGDDAPAILGGITLTRETDGDAEAEFDAPVAVTIDAPDAVKDGAPGAIAYNRGDGKFERVRHKLEGDKFTFHTRHFSDYVIVDPEATEPVQLVNELGNSNPGFIQYKVEKDEHLIYATAAPNDGFHYHWVHPEEEEIQTKMKTLEFTAPEGEYYGAWVIKGDVTRDLELTTFDFERTDVIRTDRDFEQSDPE